MQRKATSQQSLLALCSTCVSPNLLRDLAVSNVSGWSPTAFAVGRKPVSFFLEKNIRC